MSDPITATMQHDDNINTRLNKLFVDYQQQLPERINYIAQQFEACCTLPNPSSALSNLHHALHKLAGSGATFRYSEMGSIARRWEHLASILLKSSLPPTPSQQQEMQALLTQLARAATLPDEF